LGRLFEPIFIYNGNNYASTRSEVGAKFVDSPRLGPGQPLWSEFEDKRCAQQETVMQASFLSLEANTLRPSSRKRQFTLVLGDAVILFTTKALDSCAMDLLYESTIAFGYQEIPPNEMRSGKIHLFSNMHPPQGFKHQSIFATSTRKVFIIRRAG